MEMRGVFEQLDRATREDPARRDLADYYQQFEEALAEVGVPYVRHALLSTPEGEMRLYRPGQPQGRHVLALAGQHGEEIAGPWELLTGLRASRDLLREHAVSFIPVGNPVGFVRATRGGMRGDGTNWVLDKDHQPRAPHLISAEAAALMENGRFLLSCARDGLLNMHEDNTSLGFYLYVLGAIDSPVVRAMLRAGREHFEFKKDGVYHDNGTYDLRGGLVDNHPDQTFDHFAHLRGIPLCITTETPAHRDVPFADRVACGGTMMQAFLAGICE